MLNIHEEIKAEKASYLDWDEIREQKAYEAVKQKELQKIRAKKAEEIEKTKTYIKDRLLSINMENVIEGEGIQVTQEEINKYPHMCMNNELINEWNERVINHINEVLHFRYFFSDNPEISIISESESLHCKEEPIYVTDMWGNKTDIIDIFCDPITIIHVKFDNYDFHLFATYQYNEFYVASKLTCLPQIIAFGCIKYEFQKEDE